MPPLKEFKPEVIYNNLFERKFDTVKGRSSARRGPRSTTLAEYLKNKGIFTQKMIDTAQTALKELAKANMVDTMEGLTVDLAEAKPISRFCFKHYGIGNRYKNPKFNNRRKCGSGSIIAAGKGAEAMRNIALRIPESQKNAFYGTTATKSKTSCKNDAKIMAQDDPTNQRDL